MNVNVPGSGPASDAAASVATTVTTGGALSAIVTVAVFGVPMRYVPTAASVTLTVSSASTTTSAIGVTVAVADACPAGIKTYDDMPP